MTDKPQDHMPRQDPPTYTDMVYEVLRLAEKPLTFKEIFAAVSQRRPITSRNPEKTIRNVLSQGRQLVSLGDGRYGYLPHLATGSLFRLPLIERKPANHPLTHTFEILYALWPGLFETRNRSNERPVRLRLPNGDEVELVVGVPTKGAWGSPMPDGLRRYLVGNRASAGDSLLIRVLDGESGWCEAWFEPHARRNAAAVAARNRELADAAYQLLRTGQRWELLIWEIGVALIARGLYRSDVAPDPVEDILEADARFAAAGLEMWTLSELVTPEMEAKISLRRELESRILETASRPTEGPAEPLPFPMSRYGMERETLKLETALSEKEFASMEAVEDYLRELLARGVPHREPETPLQKAQELMYDAWDEPRRRERIRLAKAALKISPDCADAYVMLAQETARNTTEALALYAEGVAAGERALGHKAFQEDVGYFWGILKTRPYMRARFGLALTLREMGRRQEAAWHAWEMLRLNPNDNQGVRYALLNWLLEMDDITGIERLLSSYPGDECAIWLYGSALHAFRTEGSTKRAARLLSKAKRCNRYVPAYLLGIKDLPDTLPEMVTFGDESEAVECAAGQMEAWRMTPGALDWLAAHLG